MEFSCESLTEVAEGLSNLMISSNVVLLFRSVFELYITDICNCAFYDSACACSYKSGSRYIISFTAKVSLRN